MEDSPGLVARSAQEIVAAGLVELRCSNQCLREKCVVRDSPGIAAGDAEAGIACRPDQLRCSTQCL